MVLQKTENIVLHGICSHPEFSDRELSDKLNLKRPTVTITRNKLFEKKIYDLKWIPDFGRLGAELIGINYVDINPLGDINSWNPEFQ